MSLRFSSPRGAASLVLNSMARGPVGPRGKMYDTISVLDYLPDGESQDLVVAGAADASPAFAAAQAAAPAGATIIAPPGTYLLNSNVSMPGRIIIADGASFTGSGKLLNSIINPVRFPTSDSVGGGSVAIGPFALSRQSALSSTAFSNTAVGYGTLSASGMTTSAIHNSAFGSNALSANTTGSANSAFGKAALSSNTIGLNGSAFGQNALLNNTTGTANSAFGAGALQSSKTGVSNTSCGYASLFTNDSGSYNAAFGVNALASNVTGGYNVAFGTESLYHNLAGFNTAFGNAAGFSNTTGQDLVYIGHAAGYGNEIAGSTGTSNVGVGSNALFKNEDGSRNVAVGYTAMNDNISGEGNVAVGSSAMVANTTGDNNVGIGRNALNANNADGNTAVGYAALILNTSGSSNVALGQTAGRGNTSGIGNTFLGFQSGYTSASGNYNITIGHNAGATTLASGTGNILIGKDADTPLAGTNNFIALGGIFFATGASGTTSSPAGKAGIKITNPAEDWDVGGTIGASGQIVSRVSTGTPPFSIASSTLVSNLYAARAAIADTVTTNANLSGDVTSSGNATTLATTQTGAHTWSAAQTDSALHQFNLGANIASGQTLSWNSDLYLSRSAAATLQIGAADAASPVSQTLRAQGSRAGTDSNVAGANLTVSPGKGTGQALGSKVTISVPIADASSGTAAQSLSNIAVFGSAGSGGVAGVSAAIFRIDEFAISSTVVAMYSGERFGWGSGAVSLGQTTTDTCFTRASAGVINVGTTGTTPNGSMVMADLTTNNSAALIKTGTTLSDQAGAATGTLTNAPTAGNPTKWIAINDNGTVRKIPTWT